MDSRNVYLILTYLVILNLDTTDFVS